MKRSLHSGLLGAIIAGAAITLLDKSAEAETTLTPLTDEQKADGWKTLDGNWPSVQPDDYAEIYFTDGEYRAAARLGNVRLDMIARYRPTAEPTWPEADGWRMNDGLWPAVSPYTDIEYVCPHGHIHVRQARDLPWGFESENSPMFWRLKPSDPDAGTEDPAPEDAPAEPIPEPA